MTRCSIDGCENEGRHFFGEPFDMPTGDGEWITVGKDPEFGLDIVEWHGATERFQYVECDAHYAGDDCV